jgi:hypothetical protein
MPQVLNMLDWQRLPRSAVYVADDARWVGLAKTKWANPFKIGRDGEREEVLAKYRAWLLQRPELWRRCPNCAARTSSAGARPNPATPTCFSSWRMRGRRTADRPCRYGSNYCSQGSFPSV